MLADKQEVLARASQSIEAFGRLFMPKALNAKTPPFHYDIYRDLQDNSIKRLGIIAPRGHSKSTIASIVFPLWLTVFKPKEDDLLIVGISEAQSQWVNFLSVIKYNLAHNPRILHYFGSFEGDKWTEDEIVTSNGVRILARGTGQRIRGTLTGRETITRPNYIILDDFESETNSGTPEQITKNKEWITKAVEPSLADDGRLIGIGTVISQSAYLVDIQRDPSWKIHFYQALDANNNPLWPERFSAERLAGIKASYEIRGQGDAFWQEYMNIPVSPSTQTFKPAHWRRYEGVFRLVEKIQPALKLTGLERDESWYKQGMMLPLEVSVGVDLAISEEKRADFTVILPLGCAPDERKFILPYTKLKTKDIDEIVDEMLNVCCNYGAHRINVETVQFQQAVVNQFRKQMFKRGLYLHVDESSPRTGKNVRIRSLQPEFATGMMYHQADMVDLEGELKFFPRAAHDDILDALYFADQVSSPADLKEFEDDGLPEIVDTKELSWLVL